MRTQENTSGKLFVTFKKRDGSLRIALGTPVPSTSPKVMTLDEDPMTARADQEAHRYTSIPLHAVISVLPAEEFLRQHPAFRKVWLENFSGKRKGAKS